MELNKAFKLLVALVLLADMFAIKLPAAGIRPVVNANSKLVYTPAPGLPDGIVTVTCSGGPGSTSMVYVPAIALFITGNTPLTEFVK